MQKDNDFNALLFNYVTGGLSGAEKEKLDAWLELADSPSRLSPEEETVLVEWILDPQKSFHDIAARFELEPKKPVAEIGSLRQSYNWKQRIRNLWHRLLDY